MEEIIIQPITTTVEFNHVVLRQNIVVMGKYLFQIHMSCFYPHGWNMMVTPLGTYDDSYIIMLTTDESYDYQYKMLQKFLNIKDDIVYYDENGQAVQYYARKKEYYKQDYVRIFRKYFYNIFVGMMDRYALLLGL